MEVKKNMELRRSLADFHSILDNDGSQSARIDLAQAIFIYLFHCFEPQGANGYPGQHAVNTAGQATMTSTGRENARKYHLA